MFHVQLLSSSMVNACGTLALLYLFCLSHGRGEKRLAEVALCVVGVEALLPAPR